MLISFIFVERDKASIISWLGSASARLKCNSMSLFAAEHRSERCPSLPFRGYRQAVVCLAGFLPDCAPMNYWFIGRFMVPRNHICDSLATGKLP